MLGGGEVEAGDLRDQTAVHFLWERAEWVTRPKTRLDMADGDFAIEGGHGSGEGGSGVALDDDIVGFFLFDDGVEALDDLGTKGVEGLAWGHGGQVVVGVKVEEIEQG